ncbi:MAG: hydantoinase B/oxoprolinase family protein [Gammaproteobacteria bacterium]|nr:hydantoinase B/oxoprolinase family protein [Gammaproteobacteria bacterium]
MNPIELNLFGSRVAAICDEMGVVLRRTAFSPNIKDRLDFSCALFDRAGELFAQAAHIPVHLGSMAYAMGGIVGQRDWQAGDMLVLNDPYLGGTHLPDVTVIAPVFAASGFNAKEATLLGFVANRAHHANIGCDTPGSMPVSSSLDEEGIIIPPTWLLRGGKLQDHGIALPDMQGGKLSGDIAAQVGANQVGSARLQELVHSIGTAAFVQGVSELNAYADRLMAVAISQLQPGAYQFADLLDDDGCGSRDIPLAVTLTITPAAIVLDFSASAAQVPGNLNCPESVVAAAAYYCLRCLLPDAAPACAGLFRRVQLVTRPASIINAERPAAVAAGNVETSMRLVDLVFGALAQALPERIPAASQGTMNNVAMGHIDAESGTRWDYYETLAGGIGGGPRYAGLDAVHSHMTNSLNTPIESLEMHYPLRVTNYSVRVGSGGAGLHRGGNGIVREYEFLAAAQCSLLTERRRVPPWGLHGGSPGACGRNFLNGAELPAKCTLNVSAGDRLRIETPGAGGWGKVPLC